MLKNQGYGGAYHDEDISVNVLLEPPCDYGLEASALAFSITIVAKTGGAPRIDDFTFYLMDESNALYNTCIVPCPKSVVEVDADDDEPARNPDGLIHTDFDPAFLFQDLRIAFYYRPYGKIVIIELKH